MPEPLLYLKAMGTAAIVSAAFVLTMAGVRRSAGAIWLNTVCATGLGLGLGVGLYVLSLRLAWPPVNCLERFLTVVVPLALVIELIAGFDRVPNRVAWMLRLSLAVTAPRILLHDSVYLSGSDDEWALWQINTAMAICGILLAGLWGLLSRFQKRSPGMSMPLALCLTIQCAGVTVMMAGYIKGGGVACPIAGSLAATTIAIRLIEQRSDIPRGFAASAIPGIGVVGLFGLLFMGRFFGRLSTGSALTMLVAPLMCWATETALLRNRKPWVVGWLRILLVVIPLLIVLAIAKRDFDRDMAPLLGNVSDRSSPRSHRESFSGDRIVHSFTPRIKIFSQAFEPKLVVRAGGQIDCLTGVGLHVE